MSAVWRTRNLDFRSRKRGQAIAIDEPLGVFQSGTASYYEADGLGSITSLTDPTGAVANT